jgi:prepilin signal peptidase PulO-like enzyme (type II secretory pathway)
MIACPHCGAETIDEAKKIRSSALFPVRCSACQNYSYVRRPVVEELAAWMQMPLIAITMFLGFAQAWGLFAIALAVLIAPYIYARHRRKLAPLHPISHTRTVIERVIIFGLLAFGIVAGAIMFLHDK